METQKAFAYRPLECNNIRLLLLLPAARLSQRIECRLCHAPFTNTSQYEALSYTWGDPSITKCIVLEGAPFKVTENLKSALRHLRHSDIARTLWVDAICIDQSNIPERNVQVHRMGDIYYRTRQVIVWLGPEVSGSNKAIEKLVELARLWRLKEDDFYKEQLQTCYGSSDANGPHEPRVWEAVRDLFNQPLWRRMWTIQEASTSAGVSFQCGSKSMDFEIFEDAIRFI